MRKWTKEEDEYLIENYGKVSMSYMMKKFDTTLASIDRRLTRLGITSAVDNTGYMTAHGLSKALSVDYHTVRRWIEGKGLPHKRKVLRLKRDFILIDIEEFWAWAEENKRLINFYRIPKNALVPEPEWVDAQRRIDYTERPKKEKQPWTDEQDRELWYLFYNRGLPQREIAEIMGRTLRGVQRRLMRLREKKKIIS